jgi:hypothetical protein
MGLTDQALLIHSSAKNFLTIWRVLLLLLLGVVVVVVVAVVVVVVVVVIIVSITKVRFSL